MVSIIMKIYIFLAFFLFGVQLFGQNEVSVVISSKVVSRGGASYGIEIGLINLESGTIYFSKRLSIFKQSHSIIENIPAGQYRMFYFAGLPALQTQNEKFQEYFGVIDLKPNNNYYLGNFVGRKEFALKAPVIYTIEDTEVPKKLTRSLLRKEIIGRDEELIKLYPYNSDSLIIGSNKHQ